MNIFEKLFKNREKLERLNQERQKAFDSHLQKTTSIQEKSAEVLESNNKVLRTAMEIAWKNQEQSEKLTQLIEENDRTHNLLLERENKIKVQQEEFDERQKKVRQEEIEITARKAELRKNEQLLYEKQNQLDSESQRVAEKEEEATLEKEKYQLLFEGLEKSKASIIAMSEEAIRILKEAEKEKASADEIFGKASIIDEELKAKEAKFEAEREAIEKSLLEKIAEYDRRIEDLNAAKGIIDDIKFDVSKEGKEAKIVVKEAIRQAKKALSDIKSTFEELDEKYAGGTFKGFSTPIEDIDRSYEELKSFCLQIREHISATEALPPSVSKWLEKIEECLMNADRLKKSWEFSEAYRNILMGISTCKNYELLLTILQDYAEGSSDDNTQSESDDFIDWYEIMEVDPNATEAEIRKQYKKQMSIYHPDKAPEDKKEEYTQKAVLLNQAEEILCDPEKRKLFDEQRNNRKQK